MSIHLAPIDDDGGLEYFDRAIVTPTTGSPFAVTHAVTGSFLTSYLIDGQLHGTTNDEIETITEVIQ